MSFSISKTTALTASAAIATASAAFGVALADSSSQAEPASARTTCPHGTTTLRPDAVAGATEAALAQAGRVYSGTNLKGARVIKAVRATADAERGGYAKIKCGRKIQARTVVVYLDFPAERPSASLSQGVVVVSSTTHGYTVWARVR